MRVLQLWMRSHVPPVSTRCETLSVVLILIIWAVYKWKRSESGFIENKGVPACKQIGLRSSRWGWRVGLTPAARQRRGPCVRKSTLDGRGWYTNRPRGTSMSKAEATTRAGNQATATHDHQFQGRCVERDLDCSSTIPSWAYQFFVSSIDSLLQLRDGGDRLVHARDRTEHHAGHRFIVAPEIGKHPIVRS